MLFIKRTIVCALFLSFILLSAFVESSSAATLTWTGGGADNLASNAANWTGNVVPHYGDGVVFDGTSAKDCTWDFNVTLSSFSITPAYTGTVTQNATLKVAAITTAAPTATTEPASNKNGPSVTLNATVNSNGFETEVYFELGETEEYEYMTLVRIIPAGGDNVAFSESITGLLTETLYHYRVVAINSAGTTYGSDVTFTLPPITITITSPVAGANISRPDVLVKGTIATTGAETGVTVNGVVAMVYGNKFAANHIPLTEGTNTITVTATDINGKTASSSITVNAATTGTYIRLNANPESGVAPLETMLKVDGPFNITSSGMNASGPAIPETLPGGTATEYRMRMTVPGTYYFTATATGPDGLPYQDTVGVTTLNMTTLDGLLRSKWNDMKTKLLANDIEGSLGYLVSAVRDTYSDMFQQFGPNKIEAILSKNTGFGLSKNYGKVAECGAIKTEDDGTEYSYPVRFVLDENGIWRIMGF